MPALYVWALVWVRLVPGAKRLDRAGRHMQGVGVMSEYIVDTFGIVQDFADLHGDMNTPLYQAIMNVMASRQLEEIVRCRDCARFIPQGSFHFNNGAVNKDTCEVIRGFVVQIGPNGFCAWGERLVDE